MEIISFITLGVSIIYSIYKVILRLRREPPCVENDIDDIHDESPEIDLRYHSFPDFEFDNIQSANLLKISNSGPDAEKVPDNIEVIKYCKY